MKLKLDLDRCIHAGECYYNHPELFSADDQGVPSLRMETIVTDAQRRQAEEAMDVCPSQAISVEVVGATRGGEGNARE